MPILRQPNRHNGGSREPLDFPISSKNEAKRVRRQWLVIEFIDNGVFSRSLPEVEANVFDQDDQPEPTRGLVSA